METQLFKFVLSGVNLRFEVWLDRPYVINELVFDYSCSTCTQVPFSSPFSSLPFFSLSTQCGLGSGNDVGEGGRRSKKKENKRKKGKEEAPEKAGPGALG